MDCFETTASAAPLTMSLSLDPTLEILLPLPIVMVLPLSDLLVIVPLLVIVIPVAPFSSVNVAFELTVILEIVYWTPGSTVLLPVESLSVTFSIAESLVALDIVAVPVTVATTPVSAWPFAPV